MDKDQKDFDEIEIAAAERRRVQSFDDLQHELSGNEVGRIQRFLSSDATAMSNDKRNGKNSSKMSAFDLLMMDSAYANLYNGAMSQLGNAERATDDAIAEWTEISDQTAADLRDTLDRAYLLDDGRHIFQDAQGVVWDEFEQRVDDDIAETIEWSGFESRYEEYLERLAADQVVQTTLTDLRIVQTDLGGIRNQLENTDTPMSPSEIRDMQDSILQLHGAIQVAPVDIEHDQQVDHSQSLATAIPTLN